MPRPHPKRAPAPAQSTDINTNSSPRAPQMDRNFKLPPAAIDLRDSPSESSVSHGSGSTYRPPNSPVTTQMTPRSRKRSYSECTLPPAPTRPRKIIQMDPGKLKYPAKGPTQAPKAKSVKKTGSAGVAKGDNERAKTAQGRKIARKTAHSLIERRRRSKMNEQFGILKNMIPGCKDQDMHKLAILETSIAYMRYLKTCVSQLKASLPGSPVLPRNPSSYVQDEQPPQQAIRNKSEETEDAEDGSEAYDEDEEEEDMENGEDDRLGTRSNPSTTVSPDICPLDANHSSGSTTASHSRRPYSSSSTCANAGCLTSLQTPAHREQGSPSSLKSRDSVFSGYHSLLTSPAVEPQEASLELQAATEALLMLADQNRERRRTMSISDLLN